MGGFGGFHEYFLSVMTENWKHVAGVGVGVGVDGGVGWGGVGWGVGGLPQVLQVGGTPEKVWKFGVFWRNLANH